MIERVALSPDILSLLSAAPAPCLVLLPDAPRFTIVAATDVYLEASYLERDTLVGQGFFEVFSGCIMEAAYLKDMKASLEQVLQHGQAHRLEEQRFEVMDTARGGYTCKIWRPLNQPVLDSQGAVQYIIHSVEDVTGKRQAQHEMAGHGDRLRDSEQLIKATLDASQDMIQVFRAVRNKEGEIIDFEWVLNNHASEAYYGDVIGKRLLAHNPGVVEEGIFETFVQVTETGVSQQHERHYTHEQFNGWFYQSVVKLGDGVVTTTADITERKQAEAENLRLKDEIVQRATDKYYSLFNSIDEGLSVVELIYDDRSKPVDMRWVEVNPAFEKITGFQNVVGRLCSEIFPTEPYWLDTFNHVVKTGEPLRYENYHAGVNRWIRTHTSRVGGPESRVIANVFEDITERKQREQQQEYLLKVNDALRSTDDSIEIEEKVTTIAMEYFGADRCYYCTIEGDNAIIKRDARQEGLLSVAGSYPLSSFVLFRKVIDGGVPFVVNDARYTDILDESLREICLQLQVVSFVDVPVVKDGKAAGILCLVQSTPRVWTEMEIRLVEETAERTWAAVERARAEEALRKSEEQLHLFVTASSDMVYRMNADWSAMYLLEGKRMLADTEASITGWRDKYIPAGERPFVDAAIEVAIQTKSTFLHEHQVVLADGSTGWVFSRAVPVLDENGAITEWLGAASDITARKKAEQQLLQFNELLERQVAERTRELAEEHYFLEQVTDKSPHLIYVFDLEEQRFTYINKRVEQLVGRDQEYVYAMGPHLFQAIIHPADLVKRQVYMSGLSSLNEQEIRDHEFRIWTGSAFRWFRSKDSIFKREDGVVRQVIGLAEDVTYEKMVQEKIQRDSGQPGLN